MLYWKNINQREEEKEKEMTVLSEKGKKITIKSEVVTSLKMPFKERPIEMTEEASKRKFDSNRN